MSTKTAQTNSRWLQLASAIVVMLAISVSTEGAAATDGGNLAGESTETRSSITSRIGKGGRNGNADGSSTTDEFDPLQTEGERLRKVAGSGSAKASGTLFAAQAVSYDFWIYDADVILFSDDDNDGYFYGIDLMLDADTIYSVAEVYAVVYLSLAGGPWNEYAATEDFTIFGESANDEYVLITELMSGYPTGDYDILIELFDAYDNSFVASLGPDEVDSLGFLPLEDFERDAPVVTEVSIAVSRGGGGMTSLILLLALLAIIIRRSFPQRSSRDRRSG